MQIAVNLELLNFFLTFSNVIDQNPDPFSFLVGFKVQVSFADFPAGISGALFFIRVNLLAKHFFFPFTILCALSLEKKK